MEYVSNLILLFLEYVFIYFIILKKLQEGIKPYINDVFSCLLILLITGNNPSNSQFLAWLLGQLIYLT